MSMSMAFSSSGLGARPTANGGDCAKACGATPAPQHTTMTAARTLRMVAIRDLSVGRDLPHLNAVIVVLRVDAADVNQFAQWRLRVTGVVGAARGQKRLTPVPRPREAEPRVRARQDWRLQIRLAPRRAAISGDLDLRHGAAAGPRDARHFVETRA